MLVLKLPDVVLQQHFANRRTNEMAALADRFQGEGQIAFNRFFEDVPFHSGIQSSDHIVFIRVHAEQDDGGFWTPLQNLRSSIDAVEKRHGDVHDDKRRGQLFGKFNSLMAIDRLSNYLCVLESSE